MVSLMEWLMALQKDVLWGLQKAEVWELQRVRTMDQS
jgi:hypothetical protein